MAGVVRFLQSLRMLGTYLATRVMGFLVEENLLGQTSLSTYRMGSLFLDRLSAPSLWGGLHLGV
jgi:hypothetical protein